MFFFRSFFVVGFFEVVFLLFFGGRLQFFFGGRLSSWVKIRLHTDNQLPGLSERALKVSLVGGVVWSGQRDYFFFIPFPYSYFTLMS